MWARFALMELTYFFDVCSCWCALADDALASVRGRYGVRIRVDWKIALINNGEPMVAGLPQELWYYDRCEDRGTRTWRTDSASRSGARCSRRSKRSRQAPTRNRNGRSGHTG